MENIGKDRCNNCGAVQECINFTKKVLFFTVNVSICQLCLSQALRSCKRDR